MRAADMGYAWDLLRTLTNKELKLRYRGTYLGVLWSLANPLALAFVLHFAMKRVLQLDIDNYALFLVVALFPWQWMLNSLSAAATTFPNNSRLIRKLPFPKHVLCEAIVLGDLIHFTVTLAVVAMVRSFSGLSPVELSWIVGLPLLVVAQGLLILGGVLFIATLNAFLRDIEQLVRVGLLLLFYVTPILYPLTMVPDHLHWIVMANPIAPLIVCWRDLLLAGSFSAYLPLAVAYSLAIAGIGAFAYQRLRDRLAEVV